VFFLEVTAVVLEDLAQQVSTGFFCVLNQPSAEIRERLRTDIVTERLFTQRVSLVVAVQGVRQYGSTGRVDGPRGASDRPHEPTT
jgi:hypothetical protein